MTRSFCTVLASVIFVLAHAVPVSAAITIDVAISADGSAATTISTPAFSTVASNELLLAFVAADNSIAPNTTVTTLAGGGLTWALVQRTNAQRGTAEIWRAFAPSPLSSMTVTATLSESVAASITVMSFAGVDASGTNGSGAIGATASGNANPGAPTASLTTTRGGSLVLGVGNDWDNAVSRTVGAGQMLVQEDLASIGDSYWVQMQSSPIPVSGTSVAINDDAPAGDRYNLSVVEVLAAPAAGTGFAISGGITGGSGATVKLTQGSTAIASTTADASGNYSFSGQANGTYTVTPSGAGLAFNPANQNVTINGADVRVPNFIATAVSSLVFPDLSDIIPAGKMSIVQTSNGRQFQYTHDTLNRGPGPLVIQPVLNAASGNYQGTQFIYSLDSTGTFSLAKKIPLAGIFVFDSDHGHFHFPFVTYGLYAVAADGGPGAPVALSGKVSFCINDSFIFEPNIPNAGALGNLGSCSDPTSLRGMDIGAVDEYDETDAGQSISLEGVPDGTYWLRALVDPNNFLAEADKTNNETDVEVTITGMTLEVLKTVVPVLNAPPAITITSPSDGSTISGIVQLSATTAMTSGVEFLVDGQAFGSVVTAPPYTLSFDTRALQNGTHWFAAQTTDPTGIIGTSPVALATVSNSGPSGPIPQLQSPASGSILNSTVTFWATVASSQPIAQVTFFVDFAPVGSVTSPPYMVSWDSTTVADGQHTITISAADGLGNVGNSAGVTVAVNNSHPANPLGKEVVISADGVDSITTPAFATTTPGDLLVAFVAFDGPSNAPQTAGVTGAGLNWTLLERSNTEPGTAEIWSARIDGALSSGAVTAQAENGTGFQGSLTVIAFTNAAGTSVVGRTGAPAGAPDIPVPGVIAGDWVFAVGNDWDNAIARTPAAGQVLVHQLVDTEVGDTYWVQSTAAPSTANALVDIHDNAPTSDRWNYAAVEIVATHQ